MTGNLSSGPHSARFLLDESLVPAVAEALQLVGYDFTVAEKGAQDPEIIEWCRANQAVWIHADDRARKEHRVLLQTSGIRTLWVYRQHGRMTGREQLRILSFVLPHFLKAQAERPAVRHYKVSAANDLSKPTLRPDPWTTITEADVEEAALAWLHDIGWGVAHGPDIAPDAPGAERNDYGQVVLERRLRDALAELNPGLPAEALDDAFRKLTRTEGSTLETRNRAFHRVLVDGVTVEHRAADGAIRGAQARACRLRGRRGLTDWLAVNQFTVTETKNTRRPDVVLFVNGLPLGVIELKNPVDEDATVWTAWQQLQTYKAELPTLFSMNEMLMVSDGTDARIGSLTAGKEWFKPWRTVAGETLADPHTPELQVMLEGVCNRARFLSLVRDFIVFEDDGGAPVKKMAGYHQFHAVRVAVGETLRAAALQRESREVGGIGLYEAGRKPGGAPGDHRIGVVWHTQGSGKSLTMAFYAGAIVREPAMVNPTIVVLTDRNGPGRPALRHLLPLPEPAAPAANAGREPDRPARQAVGAVRGRGVHDHPEVLPPRRRATPTPRSRSAATSWSSPTRRTAASTISSTATPSTCATLCRTPRSSASRACPSNCRTPTRGPCSVTTSASTTSGGRWRTGRPCPSTTRAASRSWSWTRTRSRPSTQTFEEATEGEEIERKEKLKTRWAQLEVVVGAEKRVKQIAEDVVTHFERRLEVLEGKAMVVCMSRRICIDLYRELVRLRPDWRADDDGEGAIKVVMTGSASDPVEWQPHIRNKARREALAKRFRDPDDPLRVVLVRDMWLTGFDAPSLHTMYVDKPMRGHGLMQAISRVNRVFRDKPGGLVVDYLGLAHELKQALAVYTESGGKGQTALDQEEAVRAMREKHEVCCALFHGFDWSKWTTGTPQERLGLLPPALEHILAQGNGKERCVQAVRELSQAFALAVPHEETLAIRNDVGFFQAVRAQLMKRAPSEERSDEELNLAVRQIISKAVASEGVLDIFAAAGLDKPDISVLSDEFLAEVRGMPHRNLAVELLQKLLKGEVAIRRRTNVVQARSFAEMLEQTLRHYQNRAIEAAAVIEELIRLAKEMREADARGEQLGLTEDELAFYDALETNDSAVQVLGDDTLRAIARELVQTVRNNVTIDWTLRENVRAQLRVLVRRILRKHGYPPDKQERATLTVLEQAEVLSEGWATPVRPSGSAVF